MNVRQFIDARLSQWLIPLLTLSCYGVKEIPQSAVLSLLRHRCARLKTDLALIPVHDDQLVDAVLFETPQGGDVFARAGTEIRIDDVVLHRAFEGATVVIIGSSSRLPGRRVSMFAVFEQSWLYEQEEAVLEDTRPRYDRLDGALRSDLAEWCDKGQR